MKRDQKNMTKLLVGVIVALAVNYYLPREKVVPLWEGFKAKISGKSAK